MKQELEEKLRKEFNFYKYGGFYGKGLPFECGDGWFDLLYELSKKIQKLINDKKITLDFNVHQIKEKFGFLHYYTNFSNNELDDLITQAEEKSMTTCEQCSQLGETRNIGHWYVTLCDNCLNERNKERNLM
ncbi:MAG TPA: hypothetical protein DC057_08725 [Spirochaetia bacterium]|nr:hypothetical protein [Spirochaetia bacterium]